MLYILERDNPVRCDDTIKWGRWMANRENCRVALTNVGALTVSTVFVGPDHGYSRGGPPVLFETMVFGDADDRGRRYCTRADAEAGHREIVAELERVAAQPAAQPAAQEPTP